MGANESLLMRSGAFQQASPGAPDQEVYSGPGHGIGKRAAFDGAYGGCDEAHDARPFDGCEDMWRGGPGQNALTRAW